MHRSPFLSSWLETYFCYDIAKQAGYPGEEVHVIYDWITQLSPRIDEGTGIKNHFSSAADMNSQNEII